MHQFVPADGPSAVAPETTAMPRSQIVLAAASGWLAMLREALATPTPAALIAAIIAAWQQTVRATPDGVLLIFLVGTAVAATDTILGAWRAWREGRYTFPAFVLKLGDKLMARLGQIVTAGAIGVAFGRPWEAIGGMMVALLGFEIVSALGHVAAIRQDAPREVAYASFLAKLADHLVQTAGQWGDAIRRAKAGPPPEEPMARPGGPGANPGGVS